MKKITESNAARYTLILILITLFIRIWIAAYTGLGIGESYYFRGALKLDLSYFDQPPLFFWLSWVSLKIFGLNNLGLRFPAVLLFAGTSWMLFLLARKFFNAAAGFWAVAVMNLSAVFTVAIACWFQPDAPLMFFWLASAYIMANVMFDAQNKPKTATHSGMVYLQWALVGILMGLATLSKYHVVFLFAGVFIFVATNRDLRKWLLHPGPYMAIIIAFLFALPILLWNADNDWVSFVFQGSRAGSGQETSLHPEWFLRSIAGQALWLLPWVWYPLVRELFKSWKLRQQPVYGFNFWIAILPLVFFTVVTLWSNLQYHFHWQAPGYMMLFIPLGYAIDKKLSGTAAEGRGTRRWIRFSVGFTVITIGVLSLHMVTGFWQFYGPKWIVKQFHGDNVDPTIQGIDYSDIQTRFEKEGWLNNPKVFTGATRWWLTGKVDWALKGQVPIVCFSDDPRNLAFLVDPYFLQHEDCVIIGQEHEESVVADVKPFFDEVTQLKDIVVTRSGRPELHLQVYYCKNFHVPDKKRIDLPVYRQIRNRPPFGVWHDPDDE
ncbi:ArnT family glycosyltransferase [Mucilaginibacter myungsuensis]|uniref:Glycosyltransferase family 39 protein n=1 Tax=Mucilaginibacter myungsuensis TaxID=649104 RepID=A0A929PYU1_9SPHI|nr:glycosyltransferase family 39 protein [Mucilaginibacter myungsuensis]MBE9664626.1 glycosyltransferase family 39 protein [Mucilaginibacter myungsuensis]MDN3601484.1 glycosyltransferase family 39 protein [Mucilaginibacter myungsuensis]